MLTINEELQCAFTLSQVFFDTINHYLVFWGWGADMWRLPSLDKIGPEQFADLFKSTPIAIFGQLFNATLVAIALYFVVDAYVILGWWLINLAMCSLTLFRWRKNRHRVITRVSSTAIRRVTISGFLFALPWSLLIILFLGNIPLREEVLLGTAVFGMAAAGSIQLARIYPAALTYLATIFTPLIFKSLALGELHYYLLIGLSLSGTVYLISIIASAANLSIERSTALGELKDKVAQLDRANDSLERYATVDDLTGLNNRRVFNELLDASIDKAQADGTSVALLICDLDHFKNINDVSGHAAGDRLLQEIARRLENSIEKCDVAARTGGDEFAVIVNSQQARDDVSEFIKRLTDQVNLPVDIEGTKVSPGISIGVSIYPLDAQNTEFMLTHADMALQRGKTISRGQYWFFDENLRSKLSTESALEADLRIALAEEQLELFYQPKVDIKTGGINGFESLLRWRRPNGEIVLPNSFIPVAEDRGLMPRISDFVVEQFIEDICGWREMGLDPGKVSINIHPFQIKDRHRMQRLAQSVAEANILPENIILEITEECVVGRGTDEVPDILKYMRDQQFQISLDDFGTGYASLTHLKTLPVDEIKLDRSFISGLNAGLSDRSIVHAMINLADSLGLKTVGEGVENQEQHNILLAMGCDIGQGYLYSRPLDLEAAINYLRGAAQPDTVISTKLTALVDKTTTKNRPSNNASDGPAPKSLAIAKVSSG